MPRAQVVEAIVLASKDYGEADRLIILFTKQFGKMTVLGKGVRRIKSRRGGNIDLLNHVTLRLAFGQSFPLVTEADVINSFLPIKEKLSTAVYAYYILEIVNDLTVENQEHLDIFYLLLQTLTILAHQPKRILIHAFEIKFLKALGFWNPAAVPKDDDQLLDLARHIAVQSLQDLVKNQPDDAAVLRLGKITRKRLEDVAEKEFKSPKIRQKLQEYLKLESR